VADEIIREVIHLKIVEILENIDGIKKVDRQHPFVDENMVLQNVPASQLPMCGVEGDLPEPVDVVGRNTGTNVLGFASDMVVDISFFAHEPKNPQARISYWADKIWQAIMEDETLGKTVVKIDPKASLLREIAQPYIGFMIILTVNYMHENGI